MEAGGRILEIYHSDFRIGNKSDQSPLTAADLVSHHCLTEGLSALNGDLPVLSEESAELPYEERKSWKTYWLIDPLDGTREFIKRNGEFTVNIALIHQHQPVLGVVYAPARDICYLAAKDCGAFRKLGGGIPVEIHARLQAPRKPVVLGSRSHRTPELEAYLKRLGEHELDSIGSSLKFCKVAEGDADLYPRIGLTCEWDTAAAQCIVEVAGGMVTDLRGNPLLYNAKSSLLNPYFLVYADKTRDWKAYAEGLEPQLDLSTD
jgi:3'(2'), 5'-bisphosphate nucleotidase